MPLHPFFDAFDEADLHTMHDIYVRLCSRLGIGLSGGDDALREHVAEVIVALAQTGVDLNALEAQAIEKLRN